MLKSNVMHLYIIHHSTLYYSYDCCYLYVWAIHLHLLLLMLAMFLANIYAARMPNPPKSMTTRLPLRTAEEIVYLAAAVVVAVGGS